jgi:nucleotidyltransferase/DNA polymerase involved in DNA repair
VSPFSIDEAALVLDAADADAAGEIAREIQRTLAAELRLPASIGVATTRLVAKIATDRAKPGGVRVVRPEEVASFVAPLPVRAVPGVGPKTEELLKSHRITTVGELASRSPAELARSFGALGRELVALARGRPIESSDGPAAPRVRSTDHTFAADVDRWEDVEPAVRALAGSLGAALEREGLRYGVAGVSLRWSDFTRSQHGRALSAAQEASGALEAAAVRLARELWTLERQGRRRPVRTVSVRVERLSERAGRQARLDEYPTRAPAAEDK